MAARARLTPEVQDRLVAAAKLGATRELQAAYGGIGVSTLHRWLAAGRKAKSGRKRELWDALKEADGLGAFDMLGKIRDAATEGDWKAAAWFLERRHGYRKNGPAELSKEQAIEATETETKVERLKRQIRDAGFAMRAAQTSNSFQAYFAGVRLVETLESQLELAELAGEEEDGLEDMTSPAFIAAFEMAATDWPDQLFEAAIGVYERRHGLRLLGVG